MPEALELGTIEAAGNRFVRETVQEQRILQDILIDATIAEARKLPPDHPGSMGHVFSVRSSQAFHRFGSKLGSKEDNILDEDEDSEGFRSEGFDDSRDVEDSGDDLVSRHLPSTPFPPQYQTKDIDVAISSHGLKLQNFHSSHRNAILEFRDKDDQQLWLQVQTLTHTTMTILERGRWEDSVMKVPKTRRGYKVVLALIFQDYVIVFTSLDMITKVFWARKRESLPDQLPVLPEQVNEWLGEVALFTLYRFNQVEKGVKLSKVANGKEQLVPRSMQAKYVAMGKRVKAAGLPPKTRGAPATLIVRKSGVFPGVGVYTVSEVFKLAGLYGEESEETVFDSPSCVGRICAAVLSFIVGQKLEMQKFVQRRTYYGHTLAVSNDDRLAFNGQFLSVWARDRAYVPSRHKSLIKDRSRKVLLTPKEISEIQAYKKLVRRKPYHPTEEYPDPFEPDDVRFALEQEGTNLGSLIFGAEHWQRLSEEAGLPKSCYDCSNPLYRFFQDFVDERPPPHFFHPPAGFIVPPFDAMRRRLDLSRYQQLFSPKNEPKVWLETIVWRETWIPKTARNSGSNVWTIYVRPGPALYRTDEMRLLSDTQRVKLFAKYIIGSTNGWTVGALDFCGIPRLLSSPSKSPLIAYCLEDPTISFFYQQRLHRARILKLFTQEQRKLGIGKVVESIEKKKGKDRTSKEKLILTTHKDTQEILERLQEKTQMSTDACACPAQVEPPAKKRRRNADQLAIEEVKAKETKDSNLALALGLGQSSERQTRGSRLAVSPPINN